jgi:hypothetical protein
MSKVPIQIDATNKDLAFTRFSISLGGAALADANLVDATTIRTVMLEPGKNYQFQIQSGILSDWTFHIDQNGKIQYDDLFDVPNGGFLEGRGTTKLTIVGYLVSFDATGLSGGGVTLGLKGPKFGAIGLKTFRLLPQEQYYVEQGSASGEGFVFALSLPKLKGKVKLKGGLFSYDSAFDICNNPRGFLAGNGTNHLQFLGYPIFINACAAGDELVISNIQSMRVNMFPVMTFLPGFYRFSVIKGTGNEAHLDFVIDRKGGVANVSFDPPTSPFFLRVGSVTRPSLAVTVARKP